MFNHPFALFLLPVLTIGIASKSFASNILYFPNSLKCEQLLTSYDIHQTVQYRSLLSDTMKNSKSWRRFSMASQATSAAWAVLGLDQQQLQNFDSLKLDWQKPGVRHFGVLKIFGVHEDDRQENTLLLELINEHRNTVRWVVPATTPSIEDLGYIFVNTGGSRVYLSVLAYPPMKEPNDDLEDWELEDQSLVRYSLGIDIPCHQLSHYTTAQKAERIRVDNRLRCRVPLINFRGRRAMAPDSMENSQAGT